MHGRHRGIWIAGIWLAIALVNATQNVVGLRGEGVRRSMSYFFVYTALGWAVWAFATPLVLRMALRFPPVRRAGWRTWTAHLGVALAVGTAAAAWGNWLVILIRPWGPNNETRSFPAVVFGRLLSQLHLNLIVYAAILAIGHTIESRRRAAQLATQLAQAQLDRLRRQIEPHFLFNTLNAISGLVRDRRNDYAVGMIAGLSDLLRRVLQDEGRQQVPLAEEMEFLERYLEIQRTRFGKRLRVLVDVPTDLHTAQVPSLILQPLVENAVRHGIGQQVEGGTVRVSADRANGNLTLRIFNDGPPLINGWTAGIGISNSRARLTSLYGKEAALTVENCAGGGVESKVIVPYGTAPR